MASSLALPTGREHDARQGSPGTADFRQIRVDSAHFLDLACLAPLPEITIDAFRMEAFQHHAFWFVQRVEQRTQHDFGDLCSRSRCRGRRP